MVNFQLNRFVHRAALALLAVSMTAVRVCAVTPFENLVTNSTKGFLTITNCEEFRQHWRESQFGQLAADPTTQPFATDLLGQIRDRLIQQNFAIEIDWALVVASCDKELAIAAIQPDHDPAKHASVFLMDTTGRTEEAKQLTANLEAQLMKQKAHKQQRSLDGIELTTYTLPRQKGETSERQVVHVHQEDLYLVSNSADVAASLASRFARQDDSDSLAQDTTYISVHSKLKNEDAEQAQLRWYVRPVGFGQIVRASRPRSIKDKTILADQGFDAIQAMGGTCNLTVGQHDVEHHTYIYAPGEEGERFRLAARMLQFPNRTDWSIEPWVPTDVAAFSRFSWKLQEAFEYSTTLVDAFAGTDGFLNDVLDSIRDDPKGPKVDLRKELIGHLKNEGFVVSDNVVPTTPSSERTMAAVPLTQPDTVAKTLEKVFKEDAYARSSIVGQHVIWEILPSDDFGGNEPDFGSFDGIDGFKDDFSGDDTSEISKDQKSDFAITVAHGHLIISSQYSQLQDLLGAQKAAAPLSQAGDYQTINDHLVEMGAGEDCARFFSRLSEVLRPNYELLRQGKMPESETMLGRLLNRVLGPEDKTEKRKQELNAQKLPAFQLLEKYLGPTGSFIQTQDEGWVIKGVILSPEVVQKHVKSSAMVGRPRR
ncbi:MAG: DUF3352 domain-containing protein [Pirellulaceae bacterium]